MKNCTDCIHAEWDRTKTGRLSPTGDGRCRFDYKPRPLPASMYWISGPSMPLGGHINRKEEFKHHCMYFARKP